MTACDITASVMRGVFEAANCSTSTRFLCTASSTSNVSATDELQCTLHVALQHIDRRSMPWPFSQGATATGPTEAAPAASAALCKANSTSDVSPANEPLCMPLSVAAAAVASLLNSSL